MLNYCNVSGKEKKNQFRVSMKRKIYAKSKTIGFHKRMELEWKRLHIEMHTGRSWESSSSAISAFLTKMNSIGIQYAEHFVDESIDTSIFSDEHQKLCTNVCIGNKSTINVHLDAKCNFPAVMSCKKNYCFLLKDIGKDVVLIKGD